MSKAKELVPSDLQVFSGRAANIYEAVRVTAVKARQINEEQRIEFNALINTLNADTVEDEFDHTINQDRIDISKEFDKRQKPHLQALDIMVEKGIKFRYKEEE